MVVVTSLHEFNALKFIDLVLMAPDSSLKLQRNKKDAMTAKGHASGLVD